jgi:ligand-binding SRPBCC domain-containing protein
MTFKRVAFSQFLPITLEEAWAFFSSPANLNAITPGDMTFNITSELPGKIYEGLIITYKVSPMLNIPLNWVTEITHIKEREYFIDEQRQGPYRIWHHEHHFSEVEGGVMMTDLLYYDVGKWLFGRIASMLFVDRRVRSIFTFREKKLKELFPEKGELAATV